MSRAAVEEAWIESVNLGLFTVALISFVAGACLILYVLRPWRRTRDSVWDILWWLGFAVALFSVVFAVLAVIWGGGAWPDWQSVPGMLREVVLAAVPLAGLLGAAAAVAIAVRRQQSTEEGHQLALQQDARAIKRELRDNFARAAGQLGSDKAAIRRAGAYALGGVADDWLALGEIAEVEICIDLLCAYMRSSDPSDGDEIEVRAAILAVIRERLAPRSNTEPAWTGFTIDLSRTRFMNDYDLSGLTLGAGTTLRLESCVITGTLDLSGLRLEGGALDAAKLQLCPGSSVGSLTRLVLERSVVTNGRIDLEGLTMGSASLVTFAQSSIRGGFVNLKESQQAVVIGEDGETSVGGFITFHDSELSAGTICFDYAQVLDKVSFGGVRFTGGLVTFEGASYDGAGDRQAEVTFADALLQGGKILMTESQGENGVISFFNADVAGTSIVVDVMGSPSDYPAGPVGPTVSFMLARVDASSAEKIRGPWGQGVPGESVWDPAAPRS